ncbi:MAG: polysaccharide biosynthesis C-terminal domain-containing protein [Deltaproteobacteria bacterium]|nr:polysaccharide biosynthesis C-terminal domain-containing protein [Deltaproteobacteria bacterium]
MHFDRKFWRDAGWNYGSLAVQALVGVALNFGILAFGGDARLGVFNQLYAIFVIAGQMAVVGLHDSTLKHASEYAEAEAESRVLTLAAAIAGVGAGAVSGVLLLLLAGPLGRAFASPEVGQGIFWLAPGLFLFTVNKVLMGILNGQRRMAAFAVGQALRAVVILAVCAAMLWRGARPAAFGLAFTVAELVLLLFLGFFLRPVRFVRGTGDRVREWIRRHFAFGGRAVVHGFLSESFIRIDVIMLGIFLSDELVGIYSFAAFFLEGVYQVSIVVRNVTNPILVRLLLRRDAAAFAHYTRRAAGVSFGATVVAAGSVVAVFPWLDRFLPAHVIAQGFPVLGMLMAGLALFSLTVPFDYIFLQAGRPGLQSWYMLATTMVNVLLNAVLIPRWGLMGAATATAIAFVASVVLVNYLAASILKLQGGIFHLGKAAA